MSHKDSVSHYLANYSEHRSFFWPKIEKHRTVLVIPAFKEQQEFVLMLKEFIKAVRHKMLIIVVINHPLEVDDDARLLNEKLLFLLSTLGTKTSNNSVHLIDCGAATILVVGPVALNKKMGVGLARKIGADAALYYIQQEKIEIPIIFGTDADARLPKDYFEQAKHNDDAAAYIYRFRHEPPTDNYQRRAIMLYEMRLNAYVEGLKSAGSPYAYHTIASTIAIDAQAYAKVRGFPKISAGEDFYLLNKLAKIASIKVLSGDAISLSARVSNRVPFGTGPMLNRMLKLEKPELAEIFYHPEVFKMLRQFLFDMELSLAKNSFSDIILKYNDVLGSKFSDSLTRTLRQRNKIADRFKAFHDCFDAFATLKFIHNCRYTMLNYDDYMLHMNRKENNDLVYPQAREENIY